MPLDSQVVLIKRLEEIEKRLGGHLENSTEKFSLLEKSYSKLNAQLFTFSERIESKRSLNFDSVIIEEKQQKTEIQNEMEIKSREQLDSFVSKLQSACQQKPITTYNYVESSAYSHKTVSRTKSSPESLSKEGNVDIESEAKRDMIESEMESKNDELDFLATRVDKHLKIRPRSKSPSPPKKSKFLNKGRVTKRNVRRPARWIRSRPSPI